MRWRFTTDDARIKLHRLYPTIEGLLDTRSRRPSGAEKVDRCLLLAAA
jgi:hypothetical protein